MPSKYGHLPNEHILRAALRAGQLIDEHGSSVSRTRNSYAVYSSDALYPPSDLREGERLLLSLGLLTQEGDVLSMTDVLTQIVRLEPDTEALCVLADAVVEHFAPVGSEWLATEEQLVVLLEESVLDPDRREARLTQLGARYDSSIQSAIGDLGEDLVVQLARERLEEIGRPDLAAGVRRVSLLSDSLGYDVVVPTPAGRLRLEVKTSTHAPAELFRFFISRNEAEWGGQDCDWRLVACHVVEGQVSVVGHCAADRIVVHLPADGLGGRWTQAEVHLSLSDLYRGLPPLV